MRIAFTTLLFAAVALVLAGHSEAATPITACGNLSALVRHVTLQSPGSATIDGRTFRLSSALSTDQTNRIDPDVRVGQRVCLSGNLTQAPSPSGNVELVENFVLSSCSGPTAPAACAASNPTTLPSTATSELETGTSHAMGLAQAEGRDPLTSPVPPSSGFSWPSRTAGVLLVAAIATLLIGRRVLARE